MSGVNKSQDEMATQLFADLLPLDPLQKKKVWFFKQMGIFAVESLKITFGAAGGPGDRTATQTVQIKKGNKQSTITRKMVIYSDQRVVVETTITPWRQPKAKKK